MKVGELKELLKDVPDDVSVDLYREGVEYYYSIERIQCCYNTVDGFKDVEIRVVEQEAC